ncbi:MAG: ketoacyl-ACP synthase III [Proteobacteria bacterium]|nr:ketoacyl-ACP synthase III [Pseudomonadota bacterium]
MGIGHYLPDNVFENKDFEGKLDTSDEWIRSRTGIERRHFAADGQLTSDLAIRAGRAALEQAGIDAGDIDAIVLATSTPDRTFPSTATKVQAGLGITTGFALDIQAVCAGFIYALATANSFIISRQATRVLVIGAETFSRILNWEDRTTAVLFGDGAGAVILEAQDLAGDVGDRGVLATDLHADGRYGDILYVDGGVSSTQTSGVLRMEGREVFKHAVEKLTQSGELVLGELGLVADDIDWVIPHQANARIIAKTAAKMGISMDRVIMTVADHGNTSAASIPLALSVAVGRGQVKRGDLLLSEAIGGGLVWGAAVMRW